MTAESRPQNDGCEDRKLLNVSALAKRLSVSVRQVHRMNKGELIPASLRIDRSVRWREDEIFQWMKCGAPPRDEWEQQQATQTVGDENT